MNIELFGKDAQLISFADDGAAALVLDFAKELDGYISLGSITSRIKGKSCALDIRRLSDGEYIPHLILADCTVNLPRVKKQNEIIAPIEPDGSFIVTLLLRERQLSERVDQLEKRLEEINKRVVGSSLFSTAP